MHFTSDELDNFVLESDRLGGPGAAACGSYWTEFSFRTSCRVHQDLDPFSEAYVSQQLRLYEELSGRRYDPHANEQTSFDLERHIDAVNPYDHPDPQALAAHVQRLSRALRHAKPQRDETLLDMGCGWGLSSEVAAYLGLKVKAVDINPSFVRLVNERAARNRGAISAVVSTFEDYVPDGPVDLVLFYECLHHAVRPWVVIERLAARLADGGRIVLAGEPINDVWWKHWGMRLDALSVYCIRKFGWFESGWSVGFIGQVLRRAGLNPEIHHDPDPDLGVAIVATKNIWRIRGDRVVELCQATGCFVDSERLILVGAGELTIPFPSDATAAMLNVVNHRGRALRVFLSSDGVKRLSGDLQFGATSVIISRHADTAHVQFDIERWVPDEELFNGDKRVIGLHLSDIRFLRD